MSTSSLSRRADETDAEFWDRAYLDPTFGARPNPSHGAVLAEFGFFRTRGVESILDVGCGRGILLRELNGHGFMAIGTEIANSLFAGSLKGEEVFPVPCQSMSNFKDGTFDLAVAVNVLDHLRTVDDVERGLREMARVARKGVLIVANGAPEHRRISKINGWWTDALRSTCGGRIVSAKEHKTGYVCASAWRAM